MKIIENTEKPETFETFFQAESYLEKSGYRCENSLWLTDCDGPTLTIVAIEDGVQIKPRLHKKRQLNKKLLRRKKVAYAQHYSVGL